MPAAAKSQVDLMFRAFSDPIRLRILSLLRPGELCVCDLIEVLELPQPTISRHLSYLRRAGLVQVRRDRSWNFYNLAPARSVFHTKLLECLGSCFRDVPEMSRDVARARTVRKRGGCCPR
jgi:ArsR family transcriptional regulator